MVKSALRRVGKDRVPLGPVAPRQRLVASASTFVDERLEHTRLPLLWANKLANRRCNREASLPGARLKIVAQEPLPDHRVRRRLSFQLASQFSESAYSMRKQQLSSVSASLGIFRVSIRRLAQVKLEILLQKDRLNIDYVPPTLVSFLRFLSGDKRELQSIQREETKLVNTAEFDDFRYFLVPTNRLESFRASFASDTTRASREPFGSAESSFPYQSTFISRIDIDHESAPTQ